MRYITTFVTLLDCIRRNLKEFFDKEEKELFMACNVPWTLTFTNISIEEARVKDPCDLTTATHQSLKLTEFFYIAAAYLFPNCKGIYYDFINSCLVGISFIISFKSILLIILAKLVAMKESSIIKYTFISSIMLYINLQN